MNKVLVFQTAFLGDLILTSPLIKSVKRSFPGFQVHLVVRKGFEGVFEDFWAVDRVIPFDKKGFWRFSKQLRSEKYSLAVSPHRSHRTSLILFLSKIPRRVGYDRAGFSFLYTDRVKHEFKKGLHEVDRLLRLLEPLERDFSVVYDREVELPLTISTYERTLSKFSLKEGEYGVIAPGSVWPTKAWLPEYYAEVGNYLLRKGLKVVIVGSKSDEVYCSRVFELMGRRGINLCSKTSLKEFFSVIKGAKLLVSNDSSPVHVASAFNTPVVEVYGATVPDFGFFPYGRGKFVELKGLKCRPCGLHGGRKCPEGHFKCMVGLKPEKVIEVVEELLNC
ncbi:MAG: lipopolysaccharide heptosyltransferase II [Desulfurobacteriaceae bacterium]